MALPSALAVRLLIPSLSGAGEDTDLDTLIADANSVLAAWCNFRPATAGGSPSLESATYTVVMDGPSNPTALRLPVRPVASITSLYDDSAFSGSFDASNLVASDDLDLAIDDGVVHLLPNSAHGAFSRGRRRIKAVFVAGFDTGAHEQIKLAIATYTAHLFHGRPSIGTDAYAVDGVTETPAKRTIPPEVKEILSNIKLWEVGLA